MLRLLFPLIYDIHYIVGQTYFIKYFLECQSKYSMTIYITLLRNVNNNIAHFYKISEKGVIQLRRKTLDMTNAVHSRDLQTFRIYTWVNSSKTTFRTLFFNAQLTGSEKVRRGWWFEQQWIWSFIPMPLQSTLVKARQQLGISASCCFPIIFMPNLSGPSFLMQTISTTFLSHVTHLNDFFSGLSLTF